MFQSLHYSEFPNTDGVTQGDTTSLKLFTTTHCNNKNLSIDREYANHLRLADNNLLKANSPEKLQKVINNLEAANN